MRGRGIEPRPFAWQAKIIPLNQPRFYKIKTLIYIRLNIICGITSRDLQPIHLCHVWATHFMHCKLHRGYIEKVSSCEQDPCRAVLFLKTHIVWILCWYLRTVNEHQDCMFCLLLITIVFLFDYDMFVLS